MAVPGEFGVPFHRSASSSRHKKVGASFMKSILRFGMALAVVAMACPVWASVPGDSVFFSTSNSNPTAGTALSLTGTGQVGTLYIWVSQGGNTVDATNDAV